MTFNSKTWSPPAEQIIK